jgi:hypothetical protein
MLKELSLLKWREKATKLASDDATSRVAQLQENVADLQKDLASERLFGLTMDVDILGYMFSNRSYLL